MKRLWFFLGLVTAVLCIAVLKFLHIITWLLVLAAVMALVGYLVAIWLRRL